jgi:sec-independent protein translocase protein TatC
MAAAAAAAYRPSPEPEDPQPNGMPFLEHLEELRRRIIRAVAAIGVGIAAAFLFIGRLSDFMLAPARRALPPGVHLVFTQPGEAFGFDVDVALIGGIVLASPFVTYQVWRFIAPGLYAHEKRLAIPFVALSTAGVVGGALFNHYVMFPSMIAFFGMFHSPDLIFMPRLDDVFGLYQKMFAGMVIAFQTPTLVLFLAKMRLATARFLWRNIKYAILIIFVLAAVLTPSTDPWNQTLFAIPMIALYVVSIGVAWLAAPRESSGGRSSG